MYVFIELLKHIFLLQKYKIHKRDGLKTVIPSAYCQICNDSGIIQLDFV